jgi:hypothetical protein
LRDRASKSASRGGRALGDATTPEAAPRPVAPEAPRAVFTWTDETGTVGYADDLESVPEEYRNSARRAQERRGDP